MIDIYRNEGIEMEYEIIINNLINVYHNGFYKYEEYENILKFKNKSSKEIGEFWNFIYEWRRNLPSEKRNEVYWFVESVAKYAENMIDEKRYLEERG